MISAKKIAIELPYRFDADYPDVLRQAWGAETLEQALEKAQNSDADMVCVKFNISRENLENELENVKEFLKNTVSKVKKSLILRGANNNEIDIKLVPLLAKYAPKECVIAFADENTYETIVPEAAKRAHTLVLRTPIDINLAKELNILSIDKGMNADKILIDPDMGGLGYGLDYGYSIIEKIKQAANGENQNSDKMLDMPIIAFIGEESYRAKEAKSETFGVSWGGYEKRAVMWEIAGASAILSAGADIVVLWHPDSVKSLKGALFV